MSESDRKNDSVFGARLGRLLRTDERCRDDFEKGLVAAIQADRSVERDPTRRASPTAPSWWLTPITVRVSPLVALPIAAALIAMVALSATTLRRPEPVARTVHAERIVHDTLSVVRFVFVGDAKTVSLVGDFNSWGAQPVALTRTGANGAWTVSVPLVSGRHEYAFIVDGTHWVADPFAPVSADEFDTNSSIVTVGT
jgi:Glycogen recognition site of AMP-activated protein kinase